MPVQNILCICIDGLRASALGAYGNTWHATPALDALASEAIVYDWMFCERGSLDGFFDSTWKRSDRSLARQLAASGFQTALTTDDRTVAERGESGGFDEVRLLEFTGGQVAATVADAELAQLFAVAIDQLAAWAKPSPSGNSPGSRRFLWLHARGYFGAWDAPFELRQSLLDENDPEAATFVTPPAKAGVTDHDELLLCRGAYAAQTMLLDECVGVLMAALRESRLDENTLVVLVGARGYALGEHGAIGAAATGLYGERLHVPCLARVPGTIAPPPRSGQLVQASELYGTLLRAAGSETSIGLPAPPEGSGVEREFVIATDDNGESMIRTAAWMLRRPAANVADADLSVRPGEAPASAELYLKPDDRWEANEVASRAPEVAARLLAVLETALDAGGSAAASPEPLDEDLITHRH